MGGGLFREGVALPVRAMPALIEHVAGRVGIGGDGAVGVHAEGAEKASEHAYACHESPEPWRKS